MFCLVKNLQDHLRNMFRILCAGNPGLIQMIDLYFMTYLITVFRAFSLSHTADVIHRA